MSFLQLKAQSAFVSRLSFDSLLFFDGLSLRLSLFTLNGELILSWKRHEGNDDGAAPRLALSRPH